MFPPRLTLSLLTVALNIPGALANNNDLLSIYELAKARDPIYQKSVAQLNATLEQRPQAMATLLPDIKLSAYSRRQFQSLDTNTNFAGATDGDQDFNPRGYSLKLTQPLYNQYNYLALGVADNQILAARAQLQTAEQALMFRVAQRYFELLAKRDNLRFARAEKKSLEQQLNLAEENYRIGMTPITDMQEARAGYDRSVADEIIAQNELEDAYEALREIINESPSTTLYGLEPDIPLLEPEPNDIESWIKTALEQNPEILSAKYQLESSRQKVRQALSKHHPELLFTAQYGKNATGGRFGSVTSTDFILGIELSLPLFRGGAVHSEVRAEQARHAESRHQLEEKRRRVQRITREAFLGIVSGISQVKALKQAVVSSESALLYTQAGFAAGTRIAVDVVTAERTTLSARREYARSLYNYLLETLRLRQAAGDMSQTDLRYINTLLAEEQLMDIDSIIPPSGP